MDDGSCFNLSTNIEVMFLMTNKQSGNTIFIYWTTNRFMKNVDIVNVNKRLLVITWYRMWRGLPCEEKRKNKIQLLSNFRGGEGVWCLTPLSTIFQLYHEVNLIGGGNRRTRRKPLCCCKSYLYLIRLENFRFVSMATKELYYQW